MTRFSEVATRRGAGRRLDTAYVREWTLWKDITILARTVPAVLKRTGAV